MFSVFQTDLLPHDGRRGSDAGNILEAASCQHLHQLFRGVVLPDKIHQACRQDVGQMTDGPGHIIMPAVVQNDGQRFQGLCESAVSLHLFLGHLCGRGQDIVGILDQMRLCVDKSVFFRPGHGMPPDEMVFQPQKGRLLMDGGLDASHVRQDAVRAKDVFHLA